MRILYGVRFRSRRCRFVSVSRLKIVFFDNQAIGWKVGRLSFSLFVRCFHGLVLSFVRGVSFRFAP